MKIRIHVPSKVVRLSGVRELEHLPLAMPLGSQGTTDLLERLRVLELVNSVKDLPVTWVELEP